jgi:hypothetical protein
MYDRLADVLLGDEADEGASTRSVCVFFFCLS